MIRRTLPLESWPEPDRLAWESAQTSDGLFGEVGLAAHWAERSRKSFIQAYGRWLQFLALQDPDALGFAPAKRITRVRIDRFLLHLQETCNERSRADILSKLISMARFAEPRGEWSWLYAIKNAVDRRWHPHVPAPVHPNAIVDLGERLISRGQEIDQVSERRRLCRDGVILTFGAMIPLRRCNLAGLDLERHLSRDAEAWRIELRAGETKSRRSLVYRSPPRLTEHLDFYIAEVRLLYPAARRSTRLWLSGRGGALGSEGLYHAITKHTEADFGRRVTPHQLRDSAASFIAETNPLRALLGRDLLGQSDYRTTERHYIAACGLAAGTGYADALRADRDDPEVRRHLQPRRDRCTL